MNAFFRTSLFLLLAIGAIAFVASCKNPAAPREPNKFASQATFLRRLDSIRIENTTILLTRGVARNALSLPSGDLLFVGEVQRPGSLFRSAMVIRTNALGGVRWSKLYSDSIETLNDIVPTSNSEFIASGSIFTGENQTGGYAMRLDSLGNERWSRTFTDSPRQLRFSGAVAQANGNVLFYGQTRRTISGQFSLFINDGYVAVCDPSGNLLLQRRIQSVGSLSNTPGADIGFNRGIALGQDIVLAGFYTPIYDFVKSGIRRLVAPDLYLLRVNASGDTLSSFLFDAQYRAGDVLDQSVSFTGKLNTADEALGIVQQPDGNFAVFARTNSTLYILVVNESMNGVVRRVLFPNVPSRSLNQINVTRDGNFILVGASTERITREGIRSPAPGGRDVYIAKYASQGNLLWEITQGTPLDDEGLTIQQTIDDGYIITGTSNNKPLLLKVDERGLLAE